MTSTLKFRNDNRSSELASFLPAEYMGCLATASGGAPQAATVFYIYEKGRLFFKSRTASAHSVNLRSSTAAAFAVYLGSSTYDAKYGVQLLGDARRVLDVEIMTRVVKLYGDRFAGSAAKLPSVEELCGQNIASTFYEFVVTSFRIVDETKSLNRTMLEYEAFRP